MLLLQSFTLPTTRRCWSGEGVLPIMAFTRRLLPKGISFSSFGRGGSRGGAQGALPPLFLDQTESLRDGENFFGDPPPPLPLISRDGWPPPPLSEALDPPLFGMDKDKCFIINRAPTDTCVYNDNKDLGHMNRVYERVGISLLELCKKG